jgi:hypothetical protein
MTSADLDQALGVVSRCGRPRDLRATGALMGANLALSNYRAIRIGREREAREKDDQVAARLRESERKATETRARAEECRRDCAQKLSAMLNELRALRTDEASTTRLRAIRREYDELISAMPPDVQTSVVELTAAFSNEYRQRDAAARMVEEENKRRELAEETRAEHDKELTIVYLIYLELQFCAERYQNFEDAKSTARDIAKAKEADFMPEDSEKVWHSAAEAFAKMEPILKTTSQLYQECNGASNALAGLVMSGIGKPGQSPNLRKKDF